MERKTRLWLGLGAAVLAGGSATPGQAVTTAGSPDAVGARFVTGLPAADAGPVVFARVAQADDVVVEGGEGAGPDGSEGGGQILGTITEFRLASTDPAAFQYDAAAQVRTYAAIVYEKYVAAHAGAVALNEAIAALLAGPDEATLAAARAAWIAARAAYMPTEAFLFYAGPVDGENGPVARLNAWPINPAFLDYVAGDPAAGLVNDTSIPMNRQSIVRLDQVSGVEDITTGWHAIEFLLWGEDTSADGPGARPWTDYAAGEGNNDRRRDYIRLVTQLLVNDLFTLVAAWAPGTNNYRAAVEAMDQRNAIGRAFNGMAVLAGYELGLRRLGAGVRRGVEQSPFSDTSTADFINGFSGIRDVYFGNAATGSGTGFDVLVAGVDPALNDRVVAAFDAAGAAIAALDTPFDTIIASPRGSAARTEAEAAIAALRDLAEALRAAANRLGVLVVIPGV